MIKLTDRLRAIPDGNNCYTIFDGTTNPYESFVDYLLNTKGYKQCPFENRYTKGDKIVSFMSGNVPSTFFVPSDGTYIDHIVTNVCVESNIVISSTPMGKNPFWEQEFMSEPFDKENE